MQKEPTALGRPFSHELFVYFAAHDIETRSIIAAGWSNRPYSRNRRRAREKNHTAAGFFADGIDEGRDRLLFAGDNTFKPDGARFRRHGRRHLQQAYRRTRRSTWYVDSSMIFVSMKNIMERPCSRQDFSVQARAALQLIELRPLMLLSGRHQAVTSPNSNFL